MFDAPIARITGCVLIKDAGRPLPLELQCSLYQGQQGDVTVLNLCAEAMKPVFEEQNLTAVEGMLFYHVYPVNRITGEGICGFGRNLRSKKKLEVCACVFCFF